MPAQPPLQVPTPTRVAPPPAGPSTGRIAAVSAHGERVTNCDAVLSLGKSAVYEHGDERRRSSRPRIASSSRKGLVERLPDAQVAVGGGVVS
jgi:hypothetical protein